MTTAMLDETVREHAPALEYLVAAERKRNRDLRRAPDHVLRQLVLGRLYPDVQGSRAPYAGQDAPDPPSADLTAVTATVETGLWPVAQYTPITAGDPRAGKVYKMYAGGIISTAAGAATLTITPRYGTSTGGVTLGASGAQNVPVSLASVPWYMEFTLAFRAIGTAASTSTCVGSGFFTSSGAIATAGSAFVVTFGGTVATTADTTTAQGIFMGWALSVAGSCTPRYAFIHSLN